jgi:hypothetical protein
MIGGSRKHQIPCLAKISAAAAYPPAKAVTESDEVAGDVRGEQYGQAGFHGDLLMCGQRRPYYILGKMSRLGLKTAQE